MKKTGMLFLLIALILCLVACENEIVTLHCDGENCGNTVEVEVTRENIPDESWVVFCQNCAETVLND